MDEKPRRVRIEQIDWSAVLPWTCIFRSFRMAIAPSKMLLGLALVVTIFLMGAALDAISGATVYPDEIRVVGSGDRTVADAWLGGRDDEIDRRLTIIANALNVVDDKAALVDAPDRFAQLHAKIDEEFASRRQRFAERADRFTDEQRTQQLDMMKAEQRRLHAELSAMQPRGVFTSAMDFKLDALRRMALGAASLEIGFAQLINLQPGGQTMGGALIDVMVVMPRWMMRAHPWFWCVYMALFLLIWALMGGAIARLAALDAAGRGEATLGEAVRFARSRYLWFILAPLMPIAVMAALGAALALGGLVFFNLPVLDIVGGALFLIALLIGIAMAMLGVLFATGGHMLYASVAVDDADCFDAVSRALGYVLARPWKWLVYSFMSIVYGAVTYLFVALVVYLATTAAHAAIRVGVLRQVDGANRFDLIFAAPQPGQFVPDVPWEQLSWSMKASAGLVLFWTAIAAGVVLAYSINYYLSAHTWIYLLLRHDTDGNELNDVAMESTPDAPSDANQ
jgi:hypothetical protein